MAKSETKPKNRFNLQCALDGWLHKGEEVSFELGWTFSPTFTKVYFIGCQQNTKGQTPTPLGPIKVLYGPPKSSKTFSGPKKSYNLPSEV